jgi:hypothetical protein
MDSKKKTLALFAMGGQIVALVVKVAFLKFIRRNPNSSFFIVA